MQIIRYTATTVLGLTFLGILSDAESVLGFIANTTAVTAAASCTVAVVLKAGRAEMESAAACGIVAGFLAGLALLLIDAIFPSIGFL